MKKIIIIIIFFSTMLLFIQIPIVHSAYRESIPIPVKGNLYILDVDMNIRFINDYGVVTIYFKPAGGYGYGFIVMKDPDEDSPHIYLMVGSQSNWCDLGSQNSSSIKFRLFIDYNLSKIVYLFNNYTRVYDLDFVPRIEYMYLSLFNLISRSSDYPRIYINYMRIYVLNNTLDNIDTSIENIETVIDTNPFIYVKKVSIPKLETEVETLQEEFEYQLNIDTKLAIVIVTIVIASIIAIILVVYYKLSRIPRSVNSSSPL